MAVFVVFRRTASSPSRTLPRPTKTIPATVEGPWPLSFPPDLGAPPEIQPAELASWTAHADEGVKYFSGTATSTKTIQALQDWFAPGTKLLLDLGAVKDLAAVSVNGEALGTLWSPLSGRRHRRLTARCESTRSRRHQRVDEPAPGRPGRLSRPEGARHEHAPDRPPRRPSGAGRIGPARTNADPFGNDPTVNPSERYL